GRSVSVWGRTHRGATKFLNVPVDGGRAAAPEIAERVERDLAGMSPGRFVWSKSRRYIYFDASTGDTRNVWRIGVDPRTEKWIDGPERLTTGAGEETNVAISPDENQLLFTTTSSRTRLWAFPFDAVNGRI